jgi:APA family basic amino acid/polyamine antiporter
VSSPVSHALLLLGYRFGGALVAVGAIAGLTTVILVMYYGFTRVFLAMARDGLLPAPMAQINPKTKTPIRVILTVGVLMCLIAGFLPMEHIAELVNIGTLAAFVLVCAGVIALRYSKPDLKRSFKMPFSPYLPALGILLSGYLMVNLPKATWHWFLWWTVIGLAIYFLYGRKHSILAK